MPVPRGTTSKSTDGRPRHLADVHCMRSDTPKIGSFVASSPKDDLVCTLMYFGRESLLPSNGMNKRQGFHGLFSRQLSPSA